MVNDDRMKIVRLFVRIVFVDLLFLLLRRIIVIRHLEIVIVVL